VLTQDQLAFARYGIAPNDLLWVGRPAMGIRFSRSDLLALPFSLMWGGFAIFWETLAFRSGAPFFFRLWGIPFVLIGLYMIAGRFFWDAYRRSVTWYGLTSDSAVIVRKGAGGSVERIYLPAVHAVGLELSDDGSGTITFGDGARAGWLSSPSWGNANARLAPAFYRVPDARSVYELCAKAQRPR